LSKISNQSLDELGKLLFTPGNAETVIAELQRRGMPREQIVQFINRFSRGAQLAAPVAGMAGGRIGQ
jgi:hypothetical protein